MRHNEHEIAVSRGAALLDEKCPGWWREIDLETLELSKCSRCTLGQLYGVYDAAFPQLGFKHNFDPKTWDYGFSLPFDHLVLFDVRERQWDDLTETWKSLISARRAAE